MLWVSYVHVLYTLYPYAMGKLCARFVHVKARLRQLFMCNKNVLIAKDTVWICLLENCKIFEFYV